MDITGSRLTWMQDALSMVGSWVNQPGTIFRFGSISQSGTGAEAGEPASIAWGTEAINARVDQIREADIYRYGGKYEAGDIRLTATGSFTSDDNVVWSGGTYHVIDGPWKYFIGSNLLWKGVARKVVS